MDTENNKKITQLFQTCAQDWIPGVTKFRLKVVFGNIQATLPEKKSSLREQAFRKRVLVTYRGITTKNPLFVDVTFFDGEMKVIPCSPQELVEVHDFIPETQTLEAFIDPLTLQFTNSTHAAAANGLVNFMQEEIAPYWLRDFAQTKMFDEEAPRALMHAYCSVGIHLLDMHQMLGRAVCVFDLTVIPKAERLVLRERLTGMFEFGWLIPEIYFLENDEGLLQTRLMLGLKFEE